MYRKILLAASFLLLAALTLRAQKPSNLSGTWRLNVDKSDYGDLQGPEMRIDVIEQHEGHISESVTAEGRHRKQQYTLIFTTDGNPSTLPTNTRMGGVAILSVSANWRGAVLVVTQKLRFQDAPLVATDTYTLSDDRNTLTMTLSLDGGNRTDATFIFDRILSNAH